MADPNTAAQAAATKNMGQVNRLLRRLLTRHPIGFVGLIIILVYLTVALLAPALAPFAPDDFTLSSRLKPPVGMEGALPQHLMGTDIIGQDLLSRIIYGPESPSVWVWLR